MVRVAVERLLAGQDETLEVTHRYHSAASEGQWVRISVHGKVVEREKDGRPRRVLGIFRNVTDEFERKAAARRREAAVANATRLASLGELASILGHELNQPLAALTTYVEAAARLVEVGETSRRETVLALRRCVDLAERASEILKRVRRLVRRLPPVEESFDLRDSAADVVGLLEAEARDRQVEVRVRRPRAPVLVRCDRVQVEQALFNLCRNAIEAVGEGSSRRKVVEVSVSSRGPAALVAVDDNGPGIPADVAKELFEPFVSTKPDGSGLGLSISKSIAEAQGGSLTLARNGPRGAGFVLRLPREKGRARGPRA
jgi:C4-dicarboxylate-specific signal transduction histidine kinase